MSNPTPGVRSGDVAIPAIGLGTYQLETVWPRR